MERIRTKFIIAVTNRLSAAADTNAKTDLIEELSENLYQRYLDLTAQGVSEEEAYQRALDDLGDVDELLAYLSSLGPDEELPPNQGFENWAANMAGDVLNSLEDFLRDTVSQTEDAVKQVKVIVKNAADKIKDKYPDGFKGKVTIHIDDDSEPGHEDEDDEDDDDHGEHAGKSWTFTAGYNKDRGGFFCGSDQSRRVEGTVFPSAEMKSIDVFLVNGDVTIRVADDPNADVVLSGDVEDLELRLSDDGRHLTVRQGNTASSSFFFGRGLAAADVELTLPKKLWDAIRVETTNGDVEVVDCGLEAGELKVKTVNGDMRLEGAFGAVRANTVSGDANLRCAAREICCGAVSGDIDLRALELPQVLELSSKSGDCDLSMPTGTGFTLRFSTISGDLDSAFPLVGPIGAMSGEAIYLDGGERTFRISTVSGDITLREL